MSTTNTGRSGDAGEGGHELATRCPARPFDARCRKQVPLDPEVIHAVKQVIPDWRGDNWPAAQYVMQANGVPLEQIVAMTPHNVRTWFAVNQNRAVLAIGGTAETATATILPSLGGQEPLLLEVPVKAASDREAESVAIEELERTTPEFSPVNGLWVSSKDAARLEGIKVRSLADYRCRGISNSKNTLGKDPYGRIWRRPGTESSHPWYLRSSLKK